MPLPGLGLGPSTKPGSADQNLSTIPGLAFSTSTNKQGKMQSGNHKANTLQASINYNEKNISRAAGNNVVFEEGELDELGFEDLYEDTYEHAKAEASYPGQSNTSAVGITQTVSNTETSQDRSGSYSPQLSLGEIDESAEMSKDETYTTSNDGATDWSRSITESKSKAQNAILRLNLLHIKYEDYIKEGIDGRILEGLFRELGIAIPAQRPDNPSLEPSKNKERVPAKQQKVAVVNTNDANDGSESRKDRIARLLAQKKRVAPTAPKVAAEGVVKKAAKTAVSKSTSEKSKLLQLKLEALKKAREKMQMEQASNGAGNTTEPSIVSDLPAAAAAAAAVASSSTVQQDADNTLESDHISTDLPLKPTTNQPDGITTPPISQLPPASRRPFGDSRASRPLLIDVSDDEDEEMDLSGSDEAPRNNIHKKIANQRFWGSDADQMQQYHSPAFVETPSSVVGGISETDDLASMTQKIEAMKQKIADAEARKKLRQPTKPTTTMTPHSTDDGDLATVSNSPDESLASTPNGGASISPAIREEIFPVATKPMAVSSAHHSVASAASAGSERLPIVEANRRQKELRLKLLQSQVAALQKEIEDSRREEEELRDAEEDSHPEPDTVHFPAQYSSTNQDETMTSGNDEQYEPLPVAASTQPDEATNSARPNEALSEATSSEEDDTSSDDDSDDADPASESLQEQINGAIEEDIESGGDNSDSAQDVEMEDASDADDDDNDDESDDYEPQDAHQEPSPNGSAPSSDVDISERNLENSGSSLLPNAMPSALSSRNEPDDPSFTLEMQREDPTRLPTVPSGSNFAPYETPLHLFHAYRFHPEYQRNVTNGLRSLTYSNKIDSKLPMCPDDIAGGVCPRGQACEWQHFSSIKTPDDQILLQLGAYDSFSEREQPQYVAGLRDLLTDLRNRKVKDFETISQSIIEYRASFQGDKSKILPLGDVSI